MPATREDPRLVELAAVNSRLRKSMAITEGERFSHSKELNAILAEMGVAKRVAEECMSLWERRVALLRELRDTIY